MFLNIHNHGKVFYIVAFVTIVIIAVIVVLFLVPKSNPKVDNAQGETKVSSDLLEETDVN